MTNWALRRAAHLALGRAHGNPRIAARELRMGQPPERSEMAAEIFCGFHPVRGIVLRPVCPISSSPGGRNDCASGLVLGLKSVLAL